MKDISTFITQARAKGVDDPTIRKGLESHGWDAATIDLALAGVEVPEPAHTSAPTSHPKQPSLSPLMAALLHIVLWFFTGSSSIAIGGAIGSLYGMGVSSQALAAMIAVTLITFIPYAILFGTFLAKARKTLLLIPGKVWSIITICLHSVGAMIAAITLVVNLITNGESTFITTAALVLLLDSIVVTTYVVAAFGSQAIRRITTLLHLPLLVILFGILFSLSLFNLGPARHDETLRKDLFGTVEKIVEYTRQHNALPDSIDSTNKEITYKKKGDTSYEVCATFQTSSSNTNYSYRTTGDATDNYISESSFYQTAKGKQCFGFTSGHLESKNGDYSVSY